MARGVAASEVNLRVVSSSMSCWVKRKQRTQVERAEYEGKVAAREQRKGRRKGRRKGDRNQPPKAPKTRWLQEMKQKLKEPENRALYRLRQKRLHRLTLV